MSKNKTSPTKEELKTARKVLEFYEKLANKVANVTEQEYPEEVARGLEVWLELLSDDPAKRLEGYLEEYRFGHGDEDE